MVFKLLVSKLLNLGIQLLRILLSFWVLFIHSFYFTEKNPMKKYLKEKMFHVPTFMFISFYFFYNYIAKRDTYKIQKRLQRLLIPYIIWPTIFFFIDNSINKIFEIKIFKRKITLKEYFYQIVLGHKFYPPFWYLSVLLFLSILFSIFAYLFKTHFLFIIQLFGIFIYILHHSGIYTILRKYYLFQLFSLSLIQITPIAVVGLTSGYINLIYIFKDNQIQSSMISLLLLICLFKFDIFIPQDEILYKNVELNTFGAINIFILFSSIPFEQKNSNKIKNIIEHISYRTGGIYYIHIFIRSYLAKFIISIKNGVFPGSIILYFVCYLICFIGSKLFNKNNLKFLFI